MTNEIGTKTLTGPLPGGSEGATVKVRPLLTAEIRAPEGYVFRPESLRGKLGVVRRALAGSGRLWLPVPVFLVEHPSAGHLLIDTGLSPATALNPRAALGWRGSKLFHVRMEPEQAVHGRLRELGIAPTAITAVILTHMHFDHTGSIADFPQATFVVAADEWHSAFARFGFERGYLKRDFAHAFDYRLVDYANESINSFASFGRSYDLFGDGSVTLVSTPGHTAGHQSVVLRVSGGELLVCGDAAFTKRTIETVALPFITDDDHNFARSLREIRAYLDMTPGAIAIPGHDAQEWAKLRETY
jgi:glyoxylase-like metal-dependent hydrolase (beta-lactamase superfamily II)